MVQGVCDIFIESTCWGDRAANVGARLPARIYAMVGLLSFIQRCGDAWVRDKDAPLLLSHSECYYFRDITRVKSQESRDCPRQKSHVIHSVAR